MADIAMVFHWGPEQMAPMELSELATWRERARVRHESQTPRSPTGRRRTR